MFEVKIVADSVSSYGKRLTTFQLVYPRYIHSEFLTHRALSRNAGSSRAVPVAKMAQIALTEMVEPIRYGLNQAGMQASDACLEGDSLEEARAIWISMAEVCAKGSQRLAELGLHKQWANRPLEWFSNIRVVVTATEWDNFFELRAHEDAQPEIHELAIQMQKAMGESTPTLLLSGEWHLPYVTDEDYDAVARYRREAMGMSDLEAWDDEGITEMLCRVSAARCCRVSYLKHDGHPSTVGDDLLLCDRLAGARPIHASPFEHQATPMPEIKPQVYFNGGGDVEIKGHVPEGVSHIDMSGSAWSGNLNGWIQSRKLLEASFA